MDGLKEKIEIKVTKEQKKELEKLRLEYLLKIIYNENLISDDIFTKVIHDIKMM